MSNPRYIPEDLRRQVAHRADYRCEYCHIHQDDAFFTFPIDHIISIKHGGTTVSENLAYACFPCNSSKGSDIGTVLLPDMTFVRLFNPRIDIWTAHFILQNGVFYPQTLEAQATIKILKLNAKNRILERNPV
jgi:5-methylcytosine-specific restriction endonuclease McrA